MNNGEGNKKGKREKVSFETVHRTGFFDGCYIPSLRSRGSKKNVIKIVRKPEFLFQRMVPAQLCPLTRLPLPLAPFARCLDWNVCVRGRYTAFLVPRLACSSDRLRSPRFFHLSFSPFSQGRRSSSNWAFSWMQSA